MRFDAIVLSGGRSSRLGGSPKAELRIRERSLLDITLDAVSGASRVAIVGDEPATVGEDRAADASLPTGSAATIVFAREEPRFGGPAAAIAAGLGALSIRAAEDTGAGSSPSDFTVVVACDMPSVAGAVDALIAECARVRDSPSIAGFVAADENGTAQLLLGLYRTGTLTAAVDALVGELGTLENLSVRRLLSGLELEAVAVPLGSTRDIDTWEDAADLGATPPQIEGETT